MSFFFFFFCFPDLLIILGFWFWLLTFESGSDVWLSFLMFIEQAESVSLCISSNLENVWSSLLQTVSPQYFLSPLSGILVTCVFYQLTLSNRFLRYYSFFLIFLPSSLCQNKVRNPRNTQEIIFIANGKQNVH